MTGRRAVVLDPRVRASTGTGTGTGGASATPGAVRTLRVLGIDPGTLRLGYGAIDVAHGGRASYVECGVLVASARVAVGERLRVLAAELSEVLDELRPHVVAVERAFAGRNADSALKLGLARGAVFVLAGQRDLPVFEYAPSSIKQVVVGRGRATKDDVQRRVRLLCQLARVPSPDAADALAIALCHVRTLPSVLPSVLPGVLPSAGGRAR